MINFTPDMITLTENGHHLYTHPTLLDEERVEGMKKLVANKTRLLKTTALISTYLALESVNRIGGLKSLAFLKRAGIVVAAPLILAPLSTYLFSNNKEYLRLLDGAPLYKNKVDVPELDKLYFFLDDDKNYEPSLYYHGL